MLKHRRVPRESQKMFEGRNEHSRARLVELSVFCATLKKQHLVIHLKVTNGRNKTNTELSRESCNKIQNQERKFGHI